MFGPVNTFARSCYHPILSSCFSWAPTLLRFRQKCLSPPSLLLPSPLFLNAYPLFSPLFSHSHYPIATSLLLHLPIWTFTGLAFLLPHLSLCYSFLLEGLVDGHVPPASHDCRLCHPALSALYMSLPVCIEYCSLQYSAVLFSSVLYTVCVECTALIKCSPSKGLIFTHEHPAISDRVLDPQTIFLQS